MSIRSNHTLPAYRGVDMPVNITHSVPGGGIGAHTYAATYVAGNSKTAADDVVIVRDDGGLENVISATWQEATTMGFGCGDGEVRIVAIDAEGNSRTIYIRRVRVT